MMFILSVEMSATPTKNSKEEIKRRNVTAIIYVSSVLSSLVQERRPSFEN